MTLTDFNQIFYNCCELLTGISPAELLDTFESRESSLEMLYVHIDVEDDERQRKACMTIVECTREHVLLRSLLRFLSEILEVKSSKEKR